MFVNSSILNGSGERSVCGREAGRKRREFYVLFNAINRRSEQPPTLNIIFSFPKTIPTIER